MSAYVCVRVFNLVHSPVCQRPQTGVFGELGRGLLGPGVETRVGTCTLHTHITHTHLHKRTHMLRTSCCRSCPRTRQGSVESYTKRPVVCACARVCMCVCVCVCLRVYTHPNRGPLLLVPDVPSPPLLELIQQQTQHLLRHRDAQTLNHGTSLPQALVRVACQQPSHHLPPPHLDWVRRCLTEDVDQPLPQGRGGPWLQLGPNGASG